MPDACFFVVFPLLGKQPKYSSDVLSSSVAPWLSSLTPSRDYFKPDHESFSATVEHSRTTFSSPLLASISLCPIRCHIYSWCHEATAMKLSHQSPEFLSCGTFLPSVRQFSKACLLGLALPLVFGFATSSFLSFPHPRQADTGSAVSLPASHPCTQNSSQTQPAFCHFDQRTFVGHAHKHACCPMCFQCAVLYV